MSRDAAAPDNAPTLPEGLSAEWCCAFDLPCPRCRYNLRMLRTPRCPECGLVFRWQALLHLACPRCAERLGSVDAARCPICGLELDWTRLIDSADVGRYRSLYEYSLWPGWALLRTWVAVLRPKRFWESIPMEAVPAVGRLRWYWRAVLAVALLGLAAAWALYRDMGRRPGLSDAAYALGALLTLPLVTMLGLPLFVPTLLRFRIRRDQLLRCLTYASSGLAWIGLWLVGASTLLWGVTTLQLAARRLFLFGAAGWPLLFDEAQALLLDPATILDYLVPPGRLRYLFPRDGLRHVTGLTGLAVVSLAVAWWWRFLWLSLTRYLKLDRFNAASLLLSTQVIGVLLTLLLVVCSKLLLLSTQVIGVLLTLVLLLQSRDFASLIGRLLLKR